MYLDTKYILKIYLDTNYTKSIEILRKYILNTL